MKAQFQYIVFLFTAVLSYGQVNLDAIVETKDLKVNSPFTVTFVLEVNGNDYIQESKLRLPDMSKFTVVGSGSNQDTYVNPKKNIVVNQQIFQYVLEPKEAGKVRIGSALVQVNGIMYKTEPIDIFVKEADKKPVASTSENSTNDLYLNIELKDKNVYQNQPTIAVLRAYSRDFDNFRKVGSPHLPSQKNVSFSTVSAKKSDIEPSSRGEMASQVIGVYMVFPSESGHVEISPISAKLKHTDVKLLSNKVNLNVKKMPAGSPENYKNAVGNFSVHMECNAEKTELNKPINVLVKMSGEGNLINAALPKIVESTDYKIFPPKIIANYVAGNEGMKGEVVAEYVVVPLKSGSVSINTEDFSYFNPEDKKYVDLGAKSLSLMVMTPEEISASKSTLEKVNEYTNTLLETVNTPVIGTSSLKIQEKQGLNWKTILLNLTLFSGVSFLLFYLRKSRKKKKYAMQKSVIAPVETIAETEEKLKSLQKYSLTDNLHYLKVVKDEKNASKFFSVYEEMVKDAENQIEKTHRQSLASYLETRFGNTSVETFREISHKISIEKYSPFSSPEMLDELYSEIYNLFSGIGE